MEDLTLIVMVSSFYKCDTDLAQILIESAKESGEYDSLINKITKNGVD